MSLELNKDNGVLRRPRVLVADDEPHIRRAISMLLGKEFDVTAVDSGNEAYEKVLQGMDFDVVSLDLEMPGMSGTETLKAIKEKQPNTEILIMTAHSDLESAKKALKLGAYDYIDKPFKNEQLRVAIRKGVERRRDTLAFETAREKLDVVKAQLVHSEKFAAIGELLAGVAHEIKNPLTAIMGFSELLLMSDFPPEKVRGYLEKIRQNAEICTNISQQLLSFSRKQEKKREYGQINPIIESTLGLKQHDFKVNSIRLVKNLADNMPDTMAVFSEIQQVFLNMVNNAQQAMNEHADSGTLTVKSEFDDKNIRISFQDSGPGIPKENLQNIFEPLFTTKEEGKGTGLGLSICYDIIKEHEGNIYVASETGLGACFIIELPIVDQPAQTAPSS